MAAREEPPFRFYVSGSFRFREEMTAANAALIARGFASTFSEGNDPRGIAACFDRIDEADALYVVNPSGYVGKSVAADIGYALARNKRVFALEPIEDPPLGDLPVVIAPATEAGDD
jgi:hypothetical protein